MTTVDERPPLKFFNQTYQVKHNTLCHFKGFDLIFLSKHEVANGNSPITECDFHLEYSEQDGDVVNMVSRKITWSSNLPNGGLEILVRGKTYAVKVVPGNGEYCSLTVSDKSQKHE